MFIEEVSYSNYRNIASATIELSPGTNVIWGKNAQGKTNILEGIYFFARGKSFRAAAERELVRFGESAALARVTFRREYVRGVETLEARIPASGRKTLTRDDVALSGTAEMLGELCAVLFAPSHLSLVSGSPGDRRSFLDIAIAQLLPPYVTNLRRYARVLEQRNALIRQAAQGRRVTDAEWETFADVLAAFGAYIAAARLDYVSHLAPRVAAILADMTGGSEKAEVIYKSHLLPKQSGEGEEAAAAPTPDGKPLWGISPDKAAEARLRALLTENVDREVKAGFTLFGVHKDDIAIRLGSLDARQFASQGQSRSIALAMKLAEGEISRDCGGEYPVFLLDDVLSELDGDRRDYILAALEGRQIIVTSCEPEIYAGPEARLIEVSGGEVVSVSPGA